MSTIFLYRVRSRFLHCALFDIMACRQALYILFFQAKVVTKLSYASPAWWGLTSAADRNRLEAFLRRSTALGFRPATAPTLSTICSEAHDKLFVAIALNPFHLLNHLLRPRRDTHYSLRSCAHDFTLSIRTTSLSDNNFISRMLYKNSGCI